MSVAPFAKVVARLALLTDGCAPDVTPEQFLQSYASLWKLETFEHGYSHAESVRCPCDQPIGLLCVMRNTLNGKTLYVGSECVKRFGPEHADVMAAERSFRNGLECRLEVQSEKAYIFSLRRGTRCNVLAKNGAIISHFGGSPLNVDSLLIKVHRPPAAQRKRELACGDTYKVVAQLSKSPNKNRARWTFVSLLDEVQGLADNEEWQPDKQRRKRERQEEEEAEEDLEEEEEEDDDDGGPVSEDFGSEGSLLNTPLSSSSPEGDEEDQ